MSDQTTQQPQNQKAAQNPNVTSPESREPDPPCCTVPPVDPGPTT
jgi:hypothetical protein